MQQDVSVWVQARDNSLRDILTGERRPGLKAKFSRDGAAGWRWGGQRMLS